MDRRSFATWITTATAIVPYENVCEGSTWRKSIMFRGTGIGGICGLAAGLNAALKHFPTKQGDYGTLLGPVVGQCGDCVVKAYENAIYRKPNLKLVQKYIDKGAVLFTTPESSVSEKIDLLQMRYIKGDWMGQKRVGIFVAILKQLASLHAQGVVHGDVRLANMLPTETGDRGVLLDFDFCAVEGSKGYPKGLQELHSDGQRHVDVTAAIRHDRIEELPMGKEHDCFSLGHVMSLFKPTRDEDTDDWNTAIRRTKKGNLEKAMNRLKKAKKRLEKDCTVELPEPPAPSQFIGTGGTPPTRR
jgi:serine/threonine protein kinase